MSILLPKDLSSKNVITSSADNIIFKKLSSSSIIFSEFSNTSSVYINRDSYLSSNINFIRSINYTVGNSNLPASSTYNYKSNDSVNATGSVTSLYELLRGYLYRDESDPSVSSITSIINSKTSDKPLTGFRFLMFNKEIKADSIKPTSFRMSLTPVNILLNQPIGVNFPNSAVVDNVSTGAYSAIIEDGSLSGSLIRGVNSVLTGFTIMLKIKPEVGGPPIQTLFHRRLGDKSLTSLGAEESVGINNSIVIYKYGDLISLSAKIETTGIVSFEQSINQSISSKIAGLSSATATIKLTNIGGGILNWAASSNVNWLSLSSSLTSGSISSFSNLLSNTSTLTAFYNSSVTSLSYDGNPLGTDYSGFIIIYNTSLQKASNLPYSTGFNYTVGTGAVIE